MTSAVRLKTQGMTLIELLISLALLVIITSAAVPSFSSYIANGRVQAAAIDLLAGLNFVRSEAVKRNDGVKLKASDTGNAWSDGWIIVPDSSTKAFSTCQVDPPPADCLKVRRVTDGVAVTTTASEIVFDKAGRNATANLVRFEICDDQGSATVAKRVILVQPNGRSFLNLEGKCDA